MTAFKANNKPALFALFTSDVVFHSPVVEKPYRRKADLEMILTLVIQVLEDLKYTRVAFDVPNRTVCLVFTAMITSPAGERIPCDGIDLFELNEHGLVRMFSVFIRPLKATLALSARMKAKIEAFKQQSKL
jgi:hypothetical protein